MFFVKIKGKEEVFMRKMTELAQIQANGGWGAFCNKCGWHKTSPAFTKFVLKMMCTLHNEIYPGHNAHIS